jgi:hypothetical protein
MLNFQQRNYKPCKETRNHGSSTWNKWVTRIHSCGSPDTGFTWQRLKSDDTNIFQELMENLSKESEKSKRMISYRTENTNKMVEII